MLKRLFYIGLGISIIAAKKSFSYFRAMRSEIDEQADDKTTAVADTPANIQEDTLAQAAADLESAAEEPGISTRTSKKSAKGDDLTAITGIGPTYAKRLAAAGITSFAALSQQSPDRIHEIAQLRGQTAEASSWIAQAAELAD